MRIHNTVVPNLIIKSIHFQYNKFKPTGLWYGVEKEYLDWCKVNAPAMIKPFNYNLILDSNQILSITTEDEILKFTSMYTNNENDYCCTINWSRVAKDYSGIEIIVSINLLTFYRNLTWYYGWDVKSGCIWDKRAILKYKKVRGLNGKRSSNV